MSSLPPKPSDTAAATDIATQITDALDPQSLAERSNDSALSPRMKMPQWVQLVCLPLAIAFIYLFARSASHAVVVFLIAGLVSILLAPVVRSLAATGIPRILSVFLVLGAFASLVMVLTLGMVNLVTEQAGEMRSSAQEVGDVAVDRIDSVQGFIDARGWRIDLRDQGVRFVEQLEERSTELSGDAFDYGREFVTVIAAAAFNLVLIIVITVYMLLDAPRISRFAASLLPPSSGVDILFSRMERSLLRYTIGQSLASLVMGVSATAGLWILGTTGVWEAGARYAVLFGVIVAVTEFAPSIGPVIGSIPPILTASFDGVGPALAVVIFFVLLHQIEGHIVIPKLMGAAIAVHPLVVIFGILAGAQLMGIGGILLALPLLAVGREIVIFVRERVAFASWSQPLAPAFGTSTAADAGARSAERPSFGSGARRTALRARVRRWASRRGTVDDAADGGPGSDG